MTGNFRNSNYTEPEENTSHALVPRRWYRELGPARSFTYPAETGEPEGGGDRGRGGEPEIRQGFMRNRD